MLLHGVAERAEDDADLGEFVLEGGRYRDRVEYGINGNAGEHLLLLQRNAKFVIRRQDLRIDLVEAVERDLFRRGEVGDGLVVDFRVVDHSPLLRRRTLRRVLHLQPRVIRLEAPLQEPCGFLFLLRDEGDGLLAETRGCGVGLNVGVKALFVVALGELLEDLGVAQGCFRGGRGGRLGHGVFCLSI